LTSSTDCPIAGGQHAEVRGARSHDQAQRDQERRRRAGAVSLPACACRSKLTAGYRPSVGETPCAPFVADFVITLILIQSVLHAANMEIDIQPLRMQALMLPTPTIRYQGPRPANVRRVHTRTTDPLSHPLQPANGSWNVTQAQLIKPASLARWAILDFAGVQRGGVIENFAQALGEVMMKRGTSCATSPEAEPDWGEQACRSPDRRRSSLAWGRLTMR
jgi:hypothetical protein